MKKGFTLIELLVVVLIIGILSAVALPQYQKTVRRAKLAQLDVIYNAAKKAINMYLLESGYPNSGYVYLTGNSGISSITLPGNCSDDKNCYTNVGRTMAYCYPSYCMIFIYFNYNADGTTGNSWLVNGVNYIAFQLNNGEENWKLYYMPFSKSSANSNTKRAAQVVCPWLQLYHTTDEIFTQKCS